MKGDFSRLTFDPKNHFSRVLMQQGRVLLDSDWNEQTSIILHYLRTLAATIIGPYGGAGFAITPTGNESGSSKSFSVGPGRYFVDGILIENDTKLVVATSSLESGNYYLAYLDVWEQHINQIEDPTIVEAALGGVDTATRAKVMWQVKIHKGDFGQTSTFEDLKDGVWEALTEAWQPENRGFLAAQAAVKEKGSKDDHHCVIAPDSRYRGLENHLYRVEIHQGGSVEKATFKWSRDNGSVVFPIRSLTGQIVELDSLGQDAYLTLEENDWIEIVDDDIQAENETGQLVQVKSVDRVNYTVVLHTAAEKEFAEDSEKHPFLRRWDHQGAEGGELFEGAVPVKVGLAEAYELEDGILVQFHRDRHGDNERNDGAVYPLFRTGDYWLIPARTATGNIEWPGGALPPHGINHHYAPLAIFYVKVDGTISEVTEKKDCRVLFPKNTEAAG